MGRERDLEIELNSTRAALQRAYDKLLSTQEHLKALSQGTGEQWASPRGLALSISDFFEIENRMKNEASPWKQR